MKISNGKIVSLTYDLTVGEENEAKELMERATLEHPLVFMFGIGMMLEAFEKNIEGLKTGDKYSFTLSPKEAYGEYEQENVVEIPKNIFEIDGKFDSERIKEGETLPMMDSNGNRLMGSVLDVNEQVVVMNFNHPLAGETLHFEGEVIDVHEPTAEEIAEYTQTHGCGCDCSGCESDDCGSENDDCGCGCN